MEGFKIDPRAKLKSTTENTTLELEPDDAALVIEKNGTLIMYLPKMDIDKTVPIHIQFLSAILLLSKKDNEFVDYVMSRLYKLVDGDKLNGTN